MSTLQKIIVCGLAALFILIMMLGWGYFAYNGKTDVAAFIGQVTALITVAGGLITAFAGHQAGRAGQGGSTLLAAGSATLGEFIPPVAGQTSAPVSTPAAPAAPAVQVSIASAGPASAAVPPAPPGAQQ